MMSNSWLPWSTATATPNGPPHHANNEGTAFKNPWPSAETPTWTEILQSKFPLGWYEDLAKKHPGTRNVKVVAPDWGASSLKDSGLSKDACIVGTWLGHAGAIAEIPLHGSAEDGAKKQSFWVVYDPIFSTRAGPTQYTGPQRMKQSPCQVSDLPGCDAVMISHNHYDHLDSMTIAAILKSFPKAKYFVPLGNKKWLCSMGVPKALVHELDWWQNEEYKMDDLGYSTPQDASDDALLRFTCVPAQHGSGRGTMDKGTTLWCGWAVEQLLVPKDKAAATKVRRKGAVYHAGDTGYRKAAGSTDVCPVFKEIGQKLGPFDLSYVPIWRGGSLGFFSYLGLRISHKDIPSAMHASPFDAIDIHKDVLSRNTVAVHFGTFIGSENESLEAILDFEEGRDNEKVLDLKDQAIDEHGRAGILDIGGSIAVEILVQDVTLP